MDRIDRLRHLYRAKNSLRNITYDALICTELQNVLSNYKSNLQANADNNVTSIIDVLINNLASHDTSGIDITLFNMYKSNQHNTLLQKLGDLTQN